MFKSLYFKIVLILFVFIITVMCTVSIIMLNSVSGYYTEDFISQMDSGLGENSALYSELKAALSADDYAAAQKTVIASYGSILGIDEYRDYFVLDANGDVLEGSDAVLGDKLTVTPNIAFAIAEGKGSALPQTNNGADYAIKITDGEKESIIYIVDSLEEMHQMNKILFTIILHALFWGIFISFILSFFLARAITYPIQNIARDAQRVALGEFDHNVDINSDDEIGILADNFNYMKDTLKTTIGKFDGERQKLRTTFTFLKDAVILFSEDKNVMNCNQSAEQLVGSSEEYDLDKFLEDFDIPLDTSGNELVDPETSEHLPEEGRIFTDKPFGNKVYDVSIGEISYITDSTQRTGILAVMHDVTSRFVLDGARREFVANVSHELRTPLTSIKGACETVYDDPDMPHDTKKFFLEMAISETDRMTRIVSDLLVLSRLDDKRTKWSVERFELNSLVKHICDVMKTSVESRSQSLVFEPIGELELEADRGRIEQVIINIVSNAVKYTPDGGRISVLTRDAGDAVSVSVKDNGIGIPEEDIPHLFERFYRVEKARSSDTGGTGLGLAIAKEITEAHGGDIVIESVHGDGTTVTLTLPKKCALRIDEDADIKGVAK